MNPYWKYSKVFNESQDDAFICYSKVADKFIDKLIGLRFQKSMPWDEGFTFRFPKSPLLSGDNRVGGKFMRFDLDLVLMDKDYIVTDIGFLPTFIGGFTPRKNMLLSGDPTNIEYCLELNLGVAIDEKDIHIGDKLRYVEVVK